MQGIMIPASLSFLTDSSKTKYSCAPLFSWPIQRHSSIYLFQVKILTASI